MDAFEMVLLLDYYGGMLTEKQRECFDMRYNQDLSLGEIAEMTGVSRQAVFDNLSRTEALLRRMEENIGCVKRDMQIRKAMQEILEAAAVLDTHRPWRAGWSLSAEAWAMGAEPMPASWVKTPRAIPIRQAYITDAPRKPPIAAVPVKVF